MESYSQDGGKTWSFGEPSGIRSPSSRGAYAPANPESELVNHYHFTPKTHQYDGRDHLWALLS